MTQDRIPTQDFDVLLAKSLRNNTPYIEDSGFTESVLGSLPGNTPRELKIRGFRRMAKIAVACSATPFLFAKGADIIRWTYQLDLFQLIQLGLITSGITLIAALVWMVRELDWI